MRRVFPLYCMRNMMFPCLFLLSLSAPGGRNMEQRFKYIDDHAQQYLRQHGRKLYCGHITDTTVGFDSYQKCPAGGWQKGSDTTLLFDIFEDFCSAHASLASAHDILRYTYTAAANINLCFRTLYRSGVWLTKQEAHIAATCGCNFLKSYAHLVHLTIQADRDRFPITPKCHYLHHLFLELQQQGTQQEWALNVLCYSVQQDEVSC